MTYDRILAGITPLLLALGLMSCGHSPPELIVPGVSLQLAQWRRATLEDVSYRLFLSIPTGQSEEIEGKIEVAFRLSDNSRALQLDFREDPQRIDTVLVNGEAPDWRFESEHIVIPPGALAVGDNGVEIAFRAGSSSLNRNPDYLYTLFVPDRARTAFPLFDQPDIKASWELSLELPADWQAISGAPLAQQSSAGERKTLRFEPSDPISSYLFSFVAGRFDVLTREVGGREMSMLHREPDREKLLRNVDAIFRLHGQSLDWLEAYTGIDYPFQKFDFALIPAFQYGGMEHVGAIQYRADSLLLDEAPSDGELLSRASLIAHETAHMWFGDLVTMRWFDDVWTKEVFANFMAAKIVNPAFADINHDLAFLLRHYPDAYAVDRSEGPNAIRQPLANLNDAGQLYGPIIYDKAPIMMRQLESLLGEEAFREGMREYLSTYAHANADWPALIAILDRGSESDLAAWSEVWVNSPGRPVFALLSEEGAELLEQHDPADKGRVWPQGFSVLAINEAVKGSFFLRAETARTRLPEPLSVNPELRIFNADARGYGLFPASLGDLDNWALLDELERASLLLNLYENLLEGRFSSPADYLDQLTGLIPGEDNQLLLQLMLQQLHPIYWTMLSDAQRESRAPVLESTLWNSFEARSGASQRKVLFDAFAGIALTPEATRQVRDVWSGELLMAALPLSERDHIRLAQELAIKRPAEAESIIAAQLAKTTNPDEIRRFEFLAPSLAADRSVRDAFFASLAEERMRQTERWVIDALGNLHHPLRTAHSADYIPASLALLREIQVTGDIFFPASWLHATLQNHNSARAVAAVRTFLDANPDYHPQLKMKILQAADPMFRAQRLVPAQ